MVIGVCTGLGECLTVPSVLVAGSDVVSGVVVIDNRKMERVGAGATILVGIAEGVCTRCVVIVVVPSVGIAGILEDALMGAVVDSKV